MPDRIPIVEADQCRGPQRRYGVRATEKLRIRKLGAQYFVDLHVQADPMLPLVEAHILSGKVKGAILSAVPNVAGVLIHMEPFLEATGSVTGDGWWVTVANAGDERIRVYPQAHGERPDRQWADG